MKRSKKTVSVDVIAAFWLTFGRPNSNGWLRSHFFMRMSHQRNFNGWGWWSNPARFQTVSRYQFPIVINPLFFNVPPARNNRWPEFPVWLLRHLTAGPWNSTSLSPSSKWSFQNKQLWKSHCFLCVFLWLSFLLLFTCAWISLKNGRIWSAGDGRWRIVWSCL